MKLSDLLIIDIETVPVELSFADLNPAWKSLFIQKSYQNRAISRESSRNV